MVPSLPCTRPLRAAGGRPRRRRRGRAPVPAPRGGEGEVGQRGRRRGSGAPPALVLQARSRGSTSTTRSMKPSKPPGCRSRRCRRRTWRSCGAATRLSTEGTSEASVGLFAPDAVLDGPAERSGSAPAGMRASRRSDESHALGRCSTSCTSTRRVHRAGERRGRRPAHCRDKARRAAISIEDTPVRRSRVPRRKGRRRSAAS